MSTFTAEFPHLAHQVSELNVDELIKEANERSSNYHPLVVFLSTSKLEEKFSHHFDYPVFTCKSLHDFLKIGLDRNPSVLVVDEDRAECSTHQLRQLLSSRMKQPFEVIPYSPQNEDELLVGIKNACQRMQQFLSIESSISHTASKIASPNSRVSTILDQDCEPSDLFTYKVSRKLLRKRVAEKIDLKPEEFLEEAICKIRKPDRD
ncbi:MAG: hypothetical protein VW576_03000 [Opitutae bacterium]